MISRIVSRQIMLTRDRQRSLDRLLNRFSIDRMKASNRNRAITSAICSTCATVVCVELADTRERSDRTG